MLYKAQLKMWATEQSLMTWRTINPGKMPSTDDLAQINTMANALVDTSYHVTQDWQDMRNIMARMAESPELELIHLEEFKDYLAMMFEQRDAIKNPGVANTVAKFNKKDAH